MKPESSHTELSVTILGREYRLSCEPEEKQALLDAVAYVDGKMTEIRKHSRITGNDRIAILAALHIANELLATRSPDGGAPGLAFGDFRRRIQSMNTALESALNPQDKLF